MKTAKQLIAEHYSCTCDKIYTSRNMVDPSCVLHDAGPEIELIMDEYAKEVAIDFFLWNANKVHEYVNFLKDYKGYDGVTDMEGKATHL